jgi:hypothetical protein
MSAGKLGSRPQGTALQHDAVLAVRRDAVMLGTVLDQQIDFFARPRGAVQFLNPPGQMVAEAGHRESRGQQIRLATGLVDQLTQGDHVVRQHQLVGCRGETLD